MIFDLYKLVLWTEGNRIHPAPEALGSSALGKDIGIRPLSSVKLPIKVVAGSSRSGIAGWLGNTLRIRVSAPAERGKANAAVEALLSEVLEIPAGGVKIVSGSSSPRKIVEIIGISEAEIRHKLAVAAT